MSGKINFPFDRRSAGQSVPAHSWTTDDYIAFLLAEATSRTDHRQASRLLVDELVDALKDDPHSPDRAAS